MENKHAWRSSASPLVEGPKPELAERRLAAILLAVTAVCVSLVQSFTFSVALLTILGAHELGHRWVARRHRVEVSWPMFLPAPFFVGTLGALIRFRSLPRSRAALVDIGASGPIAGTFAVVGLLGLRGAQGMPALPDELGRPLLFQLMGAPATASDPVLYACWVGCLITGMNLLPLGQLDGGHVWAGLAPGSQARAATSAAVAVLLLGFAWGWWWLWLVALAVLGATRPINGVEGPVPGSSRAAAAGAALCGAATFVAWPW